MPALDGTTTLVIGRGSGIARAIAMAVLEAGGDVIAAGRHQENLADAYRGTDVGVETVDVTDESSIAALADRIGGRLDHVVSTASAVDAVTAGLAVELAPVRVNAISPGTIDTGAYDALGEERKAALFAAKSASNPARRIGTARDIASVAVMAMTSGFLTGVSIPVDGGEHLV
jgi:NAD(P)-dependent dehydrogenase (short-subunit alcohol dehydrogenase family)